HAAIVLFPELAIPAYSNDDLALQDALLDGVEAAAAELIEKSRTLQAVLVVGAPVRCEQRLFNCALVIRGGELLGIVPKTYLPNYREFYEKRQYTSAAQAVGDTAMIAGQRAPFGNDLLFAARNYPDLVIHVEICEDVWVPIPPSSYAALAGATVLANLSASDVTVGKADYRRLLCASQSAKCAAAYLYAGAGYGESTTDLAWDGHAIVCENGEVLAESRRFSRDDGLIQADIDLERLRQERMRLTSFSDCVQLHRERIARLRRVDFDLYLPAVAVRLERDVPRFPYVPSDPATLDARCREVYEIQVQGLARRMDATDIGKPVVGVSGGLDSTQALLVAVKAVDRLGLPRSNVLAFTLPGLATTARTRENALRLMEALEVTAAEIDIRPSVMQMLRDIGHPYARGEQVYDVTFENVQAGERASHLFRLANLHGGLVVGTSDLSELALGYTTYGVGDQMSHYAVNASVPKTLIRHLIRWVASSGELAPGAAGVLSDILATRATPELVPDAPDREPQSAEAVVGPYELQDFTLYYISRFGFRPSKVAFLAQHAWSDEKRGSWPQTIPVAERHAYDLAAIRKWLEVFLERFFQASQFKRSALPNGPKVGSGGSLSPRADWRAPSDARAEAWLEELGRRLPRGS
ncbi:MAG TPA: NAD(+) synthase, partial [Steroidobacteraceae bacterium]|nr:NAD(+) synthase [Steroidobacteraceae bacterium]